MKDLILNIKNTVLILTIVFLVSCEKEEDENLAAIGTPSVTYTETTLDAIFFQAGNSASPEILWNGDQGEFSLTTTISGLAINAATGVLSWTNELPVGTHDVEVVVSNSAGQITENLILNNPFQGVFTGTYDDLYFFEFEFSTDGTLVLNANSETTPDTATGNWTMDGDIITVDYTYDLGGSSYSTSGSLVVGESAVYSGDWYYDHGAIAGNQGGVFNVVLD